MKFRSLAGRLVAVGVVQLILLALTAVAIFFAEGPHEPGRPFDRLDRATTQHLSDVIDRPAELAAALDDLHRERIEVSLYDENRQLIASNVDPALAIPPRRHGSHRPLPGPDGPATGPDGSAPGPDGPPPGLGGPAPGLGGPPPGPPLDDFGPPPPPPPDGERPHSLVMPLAMHGTRGYLVARGIHGEPPSWIGPVLTLGCGLIVLVLGALITARWIVKPIEQLSRTARALGAGDLRARSRLGRADEIGELGQRFDEMAERIEGLLVTEKELLANVAHELRTPLARIGVALDLASEGDSAAARASLAEIAVDIAELEAIVDDILTAMRFELALGKANAPQLPLHRAPTPAGEVVAAAADRFRAHHADRELAVDAAAGLPELFIDPVLVRRVIDNLLENAHKYTPDREAPIELSAARVGDAVRFVIRDRGLGIPADDLPRVFAAFFRGERSRSRQTGGVGLGLTLAKRIVEAHDGTIDIASEAGAGTTVTVALPALK